MTNKRFLRAILFLAVSPILRAQVSTPMQQLDDLATATSLSRARLKPWHLGLSFTVNGLDGKEVDAGTIDLRWYSVRHQVLTVNSKLFHGALSSSDDAFAAGTFREIYLIHQLIDQTTEPVHSFSAVKGLVAIEQERTFGKTKLHCLSVAGNKEAVAGPAPAHGSQFCVEPAMPGVLRLHFEPGLTMVRNRLATFQNTSVALDNVISYSGQNAIVGHTDTLASSPVPTAEAPLAATQEGPIVLPAAVVAGRKLSGETPHYPLSARESHTSGSVVLAGIIDKAGHLKDLTSVGSPDAALSQAALAAVRTWTYSPYLLDGDPTEVETTITVNFNLSR